MPTKNLSRMLFIILIVATAAFAQTPRHPLKLDDLARFRNVKDRKSVAVPERAEILLRIQRTA